MQEKPQSKFLRWIRFIDRIQFWHKDELVHRTHVEAARSLAEPNASKQLWVKILQTENDYVGVDPEIVEFWKAFSKAMKRRNIPIRAFEFLRSPERQQELYNKGRSKVQFDGSHQHGKACDIIHATRAWQLSKKEWDCIGSVGKEIARKRNIKITWGGDWISIYDPAHWELKDWRKTIINKSAAGFLHHGK
mgnify:FL=1